MAYHKKGMMGKKKKPSKKTKKNYLNVMATKKLLQRQKAHWMKSGKGYKLMKNPAGGYKPHPGQRTVLIYRQRINV